MLTGVGLGFRREIAKQIIELRSQQLSFVELAPENWMDIGGALGKMLRGVAERYPLTCHGLSLSLGSPEPLDLHFLSRLKFFLSQFSVKIYSEHLSYCKCDNAHLYDLLPLPFCEEAIVHVSKRIRLVQEVLEQKIAIENVSYYCSMPSEMSESAFLSSVLEEADCLLLLDINNVYVNAFNHRYDPYDFISSLPLEKVAYVHIAGHEKQTEELIIDTHGQPIIDPVYHLLSSTLPKMPPVPILLERDFNFGPFDLILNEVAILQDLIHRYGNSYATR